MKLEIKFILYTLLCFGLYNTGVGLYSYIPQKNQCYIFQDAENGFGSAIYKVESLFPSIKLKKYFDVYQKYSKNEYQVNYKDFLKYRNQYILAVCQKDTTQSYKSVPTGKQIKVAVIDTGILTYDRPDFKITESQKKSFYSRQPTALQSAFRYHGSIIADLIVSYESNNKNVEKLSYNVQLFDYNVYGEQSSNEEVMNASIKAYSQAIKDKIKIINYSSSGGNPSLDEYNELKKLEENGIIVVVSAGNNRSDLSKEKFYPCSYKELSNVICVGALDSSNKNVSGQSNYQTEISEDSYIDIYAPSKNGSTSFAAPNVTKMLISLWIMYPELSYKEIIKLLPIKMIRSNQAGLIKTLDEEMFLNSL